MRRNPYRELQGGASAGVWTHDVWEEAFKGDFDKSGQLNAQDQKDAGYKISNVLAKAASMRNNPMRVATVTDQVKRNILAAVHGDSERGMKVVAQTMGEAVYKIVDYAGWTRKVLGYQELKQGDQFRIPKDVDVVGWVVGQDGQSIVSQLRTKYSFPGTFKNTAFTEIDIIDIMEANWDILDRGIDRSAQQIMRNEDVKTYQLLNTSAATVNDTVGFATLNLSAFEDVRFQVERWRLNADKFLINRAEVSDIVKTMSGDVDFVTQRELILAGFIGNVLNCQIITSAGIGVEEVVPAGTIFAVTEGMYLGRIGERLAIQSETYNQLVNKELKKGVAQYEIIGLGIGNSRGVAKGTK